MPVGPLGMKSAAESSKLSVVITCAVGFTQSGLCNLIRIHEQRCLSSVLNTADSRLVEAAAAVRPVLVTMKAP